jgi:hypothetical protein
MWRMTCQPLSVRPCLEARIPRASIRAGRSVTVLLKDVVVRFNSSSGGGADGVCPGGTDAAVVREQWEPKPPPPSPSPSPPPWAPSPPPAAICTGHGAINPAWRQAKCSRYQMSAGCKCGSKNFLHDPLSDNPVSTSKFCCHGPSKTLVVGPQKLSLTSCKDTVPGPCAASSGGGRTLLAARLGKGNGTSFDDLEWSAHVMGTAELQLANSGGDDDEQDALTAHVTLNAEHTFSVSRGAYKFGSLRVNGYFAYTGDALELSGAVTFTLPCQDETPMATGEMRLGVRGGAGDALSVVGGYGTLKVMCNDGGIFVAGGAAKITAGPVTMTDVVLTLDFSDKSLKNFGGRLSGVIDVTFDNVVVGPSLGGGAAGGGDADAAAAVSKSFVDVRMSEVNGFELTKTTVVIPFNINSESSGGMKFSAVGTLEMTYPCGTGERAHASATLAATVPDALDVKALVVSATYTCGDITADQPR